MNTQRMTSIVKTALVVHGICDELDEVIMQTFAFGDDDDHIIYGVIVGIGYGPEEGVSFQVTNTRFRGRGIQKIVVKGNGRATLHTESGLAIEGHFGLNV